MNKYFGIGFVFLFSIFTYPYWSFVQDDTYINMTFAKNLIEHNQLAFNLDEPIHALTSPLWFIITLLSLKISLLIFNEYETGLLLIKLFSGFFAFGSIVYFNLVVNYISKNKWIVALATFLLVSDVWFWRWSFSAMETSLSMFFLMLVTYLYMISEKKVEIITSTAMTGFLIRPEIVLLSLIFSVDLFINHSHLIKFSKIDKKIVIPTTLIFSLWILVSLFNFNSLFPMVSFAKKNILTSFQSMIYVAKVLLSSQFISLIILSISVISFFRKKSSFLSHHDKKLITFFICWCFVVPSYYILKGHFPLSRYLLMITPFIILSNVILIKYSILELKVSKNFLKPFIISSMVFSLSVNYYVSHSRVLPSSGISKIIAYKKIGNFINDNLPTDIKISTSEIGVLGFFANRYLIDLGGLIAPSKSYTVKRKSMGNTSFLHHIGCKYSIKIFNEDEFNEISENGFLSVRGLSYELIKVEEFFSQVASMNPRKLYMALCFIDYSSKEHQG